MAATPKTASRLAAFGLAVGLLFATTMGLGAQPAAAPPEPRTTEANITRLTAGLMEHSQFAHHPFDSALAGLFLDRYLDSLDGTRSLFTQSDLNEFAAYRATLAQATRGAGDTRTAQAVFRRYLERLEQQTAYVTNLLETDKFDFTGREVYSFDREHAQRPRDLAAAEQVWRQQLRSEYLEEKLGDKPPAQIVSTLTRRHAQELRTMKAFRSDEVLEVYLNALAHVYDPHSDYLGHEQMESLAIAMNLSLFGIGAALETADGYTKIRELIPGGPASRSGLLKPGDRIVAVAQGGKEPVDIVNMPLSRAVELIRGPKGSTVTLRVIRGGAADASLTKTVSLVRDEIKLEDQEAKAYMLDLPTGKGDLPTAKGARLRLGVIDLPSFYAEMQAHEAARPRSATADVARLLTKLKAEHVGGVVLDLRHNGGGSLQEAITMTGLFIKKGPVVQTRDQTGAIEVSADTDPAVLYDGPLVLLTSRFSASASEILAGALKDYGRALIVGDSSTFGKGTVQNILPLAGVMDQANLTHAYDPGALKITTSKFYLPGGASTQLRGVASDIVLPSTSDFSEVNESALKSPLPWDAVPAAPHEQLNRVQPYVGPLREKSVRRVAAEREFGLLADDVARLRKNLATKSISLNEAERRLELAQSKARQKQRQAEERTLRAAQPTTYEITLQNVSSPGLPRPVAFESKAETASSSVPSTTGDELGEVSTHRLSAGDIILSETEKILADYVGLLGRQSAPAGPGTGLTSR